ncbi:TBC1 domain family member 19 [Apis laboriosa]|uniref:TBC1 domain family member 19 n=1 Tax=Apis laboriosa TaxID=183418 RepID=UPI001CC78B66|nr:TBC1 domain family member 19 [Apis laboriosa]
MTDNIEESNYIEESKKTSLKKSAEKLTEEIQSMANYKSLYTEIQKLVASTAVKREDFKNTLLDALKSNGLETEIRNTVFHWVRSQGSLSAASESTTNEVDLTYLKKAQIQWERRIQKSLNSTCNELNVPLARIRPNADREELAEKWNELSTYDIGDLNIDLLNKNSNKNVKKSNYNKFKDELNWEFSHIEIRVKTLMQLRCLYVELAKGMPLLGVNPDMPSSENFANLEEERIYIGEKILKSNHAPIAQEFLKRGAPRALRGRLWSLVLGSAVKQNDVQLTARNDDQYFVFEDVLYKTMLCFSRDSEVLAPVTTDRSAGGQVIHAVLQGKPATLENTLVFPPSGVIPFHGFTMYATPFCYLYDDPCAMYYTFRAFYLRYWFRLHTVSSHEQGIVALCLLFERLLQCHEPLLWIHFRNIHIQPIRIVFKWIMRGFSGHLPPEQLLCLWDLILGYDSLEIIPLLAVTILSFRKENLMQVNNQQSVEAVLADLSSLKVVPLLQLALLRE